jgi:hypothetical protein
MSKPLLATILMIAAAHARAEKVTMTSAKQQLGEAMKAVKAPKKLPKGLTQDEYGALTYPNEETRVFDLDALDYAQTPQQIANICMQLSVDFKGNLVPGGPAPPGWDQGQVWNRFYVPLQRLVGYRPDGTAIYEAVDGVGENEKKWLYPRLRTRTRGDATEASLKEFHASGPR